MDHVKVSVGAWICFGENDFHAYVMHVYNETEIAAGYYQNGHKVVKEDFIWDGNKWQFKNTGPSGSYLTGHDAMIVKNGPKAR